MGKYYRPELVFDNYCPIEENDQIRRLTIIVSHAEMTKLVDWQSLSARPEWLQYRWMALLIIKSNDQYGRMATDPDRCGLYDVDQIGHCRRGLTQYDHFGRTMADTGKRYSQCGQQRERDHSGPGEGLGWKWVLHVFGSVRWRAAMVNCWYEW